MADMVDFLYTNPYGQAAFLVVKILAVLVPLLLAVAYLTYAERKVIAAMQLRKGPNVVGPFGLLQPIADAVKLLFKETILPSGANRVVFLMAPMLTFILAMIGWAVIPFDAGLVLADINVGILYRSEEHTSELQSLMRISYAVFCLKNTIRDTSSHHDR